MAARLDACCGVHYFPATWGAMDALAGHRRKLSLLRKLDPGLCSEHDLDRVPKLRKTLRRLTLAGLEARWQQVKKDADGDDQNSDWWRFPPAASS